MLKEPKCTMKEQVYLNLRNEILSGHYSDGQQLLQKDLAEKYKVSRIPVREALNQLASEGLVKLIPYKGAVVASFSLEELHEIFEIRYALESLIIRYVVMNITEESAQRVHELLLESIKTPPALRSRNTNWEFHRALYQIAGKKRLLALIESQYEKMDRYIQVDITQPHVQENAFRSHDAILQACRAGDAVEATVLLHEHMMTAIRRLDAFLREKMSNPAPNESFTLFPPLTKGNPSFPEMTPETEMVN
ncbi:MAG: GntR family transcriptional regulator [Pyramidobacter sp.]|jgi:DNA-binding GntR family transcriptional regulator